MDTVYLSRHFSENTYLVAGKCRICYQEDDDVQITGINRNFLIKFDPNSINSPILKGCDFNQNFLIILEENQTKKFKFKFIPPISPYHLIEEQLFDDPWKLLTATIFLNKTPLKSCKNHLEWFFNEIESPQKLLETEIITLEKFFESLGLKRTRAAQIYYMTHDYLFKNWKNVDEIYGIGEYGRDAYNMFCLGRFDVEPKDRYLRIYKNWYLKVYLGNNKNDLHSS